MIYTIVRKDDNGKIDAIISFDSITSMDESWSATVTSQTVEYGFNISDNTNIEAPTYNINAVLSSYSLFSKTREIVWDGEEFSSGGEPNLNYHIEVRDQMIKVFSDRKVVTLIESSVNSENANDKVKVEELKSGYFKEIEDCVISSLSFSHPDTGTGAIHADIKLQKIVMANVAITELAEGEKIALLRESPTNFEPFSGGNKKVEEGIIDPKTGLPDEELMAATSNYEEQRKLKDAQYGLTHAKEGVGATQDSRWYIENTGELSTVVDVGGNPTAIIGGNPAILMTPEGGRVKDVNK